MFPYYENIEGGITDPCKDRALNTCYLQYCYFKNKNDGLTSLEKSGSGQREY